METRNSRQAHDLVHSQHGGRFHETIDHEAMFRRVDVPPTLVMTLEMQAARGHRTKQGLQGREGNRGLRRLRESWALSALYIHFVLRGLAVSAFCGDTLA